MRWVIGYCPPLVVQFTHYPVLGQCSLRNDRVPIIQLATLGTATVSIHPDTDVARLRAPAGAASVARVGPRDTQGSIRQAVGWILLGMEESVHTEDRNRYKG